MKRISLVLFGAFFLLLQSQAQLKDVKHVILIGCDGLGAYAFDSANIPNMSKLMKEGAYSLEARCVLPSSSAVNWASMIMGAGPTMHGYTEWGSQTPEIPSVVKNKWGLFPSVIGELKEQRPNSKSGVIYSWGGIGYLFEKPAVDLDIYTGNDSLSAAKTIEFFTSQKPAFTFVHFDQPDGVGHNIGHRTPEYYDMVHTVDGYVGQIMKAVEKAGLKENTIIILSADHGGTGKGHGGKSMDEVQIPWIISGPGIKKNHQIENAIITYDTAPTIAYILGLKTPEVWRGKPVMEAFEK